MVNEEPNQQSKLFIVIVAFVKIFNRKNFEFSGHLDEVA